MYCQAVVLCFQMEVSAHRVLTVAVLLGAVTLPALYLVDRDASFSQQLRETKELVDEAWAGVLAAFEQSAAQVRPSQLLSIRIGDRHCHAYARPAADRCRLLRRFNARV